MQVICNFKLGLFCALMELRFRTYCLGCSMEWGKITMMIHKVINNNQVICLDARNRECIVIGRGIGFKAKTGQNVPESKIEKVFHLESPAISSKFQQLVEKIPLEHIEVTDEIISYVKCSLGKKISDNIYISLTDHINFAIERYEKGMNFNNAMLWEIKRFYHHEYELGVHAIRHIETRLGVRLPEDEAGFIALHIVNAEIDGEMDQTVKMTHIIQGILNVIKYYFRMEFKEDSLDFDRFLTHLRFFSQRLIGGKLYTTEDREFCEMIRVQYPREYGCVEKIRDYIMKEYDHRMTEEEMMYLTVHIRRLVKET